ncbi:MAG: protein kinase domain-containing protein [Fibrobacterota bacterium]
MQPLSLQKIEQLKTLMELVDFEDAIGFEFERLVDDVVAERLNAGLFWSSLLRQCFSGLSSSKIISILQDPNERYRLRNFMKVAAPPRLKMFMGTMLNLHDSNSKVALIHPEEWNLDAGNFIETFYFDNIRQEFVSFLDPGKVIVRVYYSLDHTLGEGSEATLHFALMGMARKISEDSSLPLKKRYVPFTDGRGRLLVSQNIMVAKKPHSSKSGKAVIDLQRHQNGSINLRDLTLPHLYTPESKKTLPGLWSLPRFADFGKDRRLYYEYVEGWPLQELLLDDRFDLLARLITLKHIAQALHYMHSKGYIHNDIKPQNIIIARTGIATIIDFGLTEKYTNMYKQMDSPLYKKITGTPFYMSPEQITKRSQTTQTTTEIRYAASVNSADELAMLRRETPERIVMIGGIPFKEVDEWSFEPKSPFFHDEYLDENFFVSEQGDVVPITGKSDIFSLGVNILFLTTGEAHIKEASDTQKMLKQIATYQINLPDIEALMPQPLNITEGTVQGCYKERLKDLITSMLQLFPHRRPCAQEVADQLQEIIWLYFGGDRTFFSTFDDECTYLRNRIYRKNPE